MNEKVSVIVPIYNVEPYLERCLDSILKQTYRNIEMILVDDGSTDSCPDICDRYAKEYQQIQVIHKENGGLSSARNAGLDVSTGELIMFVDSDDFIEPDMLLKLYDVLYCYDADMSICNLQAVNEVGVEINFWPHDVIKDECIDNMYYWEKVFEDNGMLFYVVVWNKLYKKRLWEKVRYPVGKINEDAYVLHNLIKQCKKIACTSYIGYNYVQRSTSIMGRKKTKADFDLFDAWLARIDYFNTILRNDLIKKEMAEYLDELIEIYPKCRSAAEFRLFRIYYERYQLLYKKFYFWMQESFREKVKRIGCGKCPMAVFLIMQVYRFFWFKLHNIRNIHNER